MVCKLCGGHVNHYLCHTILRNQFFWIVTWLPFVCNWHPHPSVSSFSTSSRYILLIEKHFLLMLLCIPADDVFEEEEELEELERLHARGLMAAADGAANEINGNAAVGSDSSEMLMDAAGQQLTRHKGGKIDAEEVGDDDDHDPENDDVDGDTDHDEDEEEEEEEDIEEEEEVILQILLDGLYSQLAHFAHLEGYYALLAL